eukprot:928559_1
MIPKTAAERAQRLTVYGFIRTNYTLTMPDVLINLCVAMYVGVYDEWNMEITHPEYELDTDLNALKIQDPGAIEKWRNAFGTLLLKKGDVHTWRFQMITAGDLNRNVMFGIVEYNESITEMIAPKQWNDFFCDRDCEEGGLGYYVYDGNAFLGKDGRSDYGQPVGPFDVVSVTLDLRESNNRGGVLSVMVNDIEQGIMCSDVDVNKSYCMAMSSFRVFEKIRLLSDTQHVMVMP